MAIPMINEVREAYPGSNVTLVVPEYLAELYEQNPAVDGLLRIPAKHIHGLISVMKVKELVGAHDFDLAYILPPSFGAAASLKLAGVKERIGYVADGRRLLLTRPLPLPTPLNCQHRAITYFDLLRRSTGQDLEFNMPKLLLNEADTQVGLDLLAQVGLTAETKFAAVAFQAAAESRRWGTERYTTLARRIIESSELSVVLIGGPDEVRVGDEIVAAIGSDRVVSLAGRGTLRGSAAVLARAVYFVGNDSGPAHLAAAVGTPLVVLSGADDPQETSPLARHKRLIYRTELECIGCVKNKCPLNHDAFMKCMTSISVGDVLKEIEQIRQEPAA
jgi:heptosyltransferase II